MQVKVFGFTRFLMEEDDGHEEQEITDVINAWLTQNPGCMSVRTDTAQAAVGRDAIRLLIFVYYEQHNDNQPTEESTRYIQLEDLLDLSRYTEGTRAWRIVDTLLKEADEFGVSVRSGNCLQDMGVMRIVDMVRVSEDAYMKKRNFGKKSLKELREIAAELGFRLGMTDEQLVRMILEADQE